MNYVHNLQVYTKIFYIYVISYVNSYQDGIFQSNRENGYWQPTASAYGQDNRRCCRDLQTLWSTAATEMVSCFPCPLLWKLYDLGDCPANRTLPPFCQ